MSTGRHKHVENQAAFWLWRPRNHRGGDTTAAAGSKQITWFDWMLMEVISLQIVHFVSCCAANADPLSSSDIVTVNPPSEILLTENLFLSCNDDTSWCHIEKHSIMRRNVHDASISEAEPRTDKVNTEEKCYHVCEKPLYRSAVSSWCFIQESGVAPNKKERVWIWYIVLYCIKKQKHHN